MTVEDRFWGRLRTTATGCREWTGAKNAPNGYGQIMRDGKNILTHRLAWELANGSIPDGLYVLHRCDNHPCCETNPTEGYPEGHLFLGTKAENSADMVSKGRSRNGRAERTHCKDKHEYTEANTYHRPDGSRACRICKRAYLRSWRLNRRATNDRSVQL